MNNETRREGAGKPGGDMRFGKIAGAHALLGQDDGEKVGLCVSFSPQQYHGKVTRQDRVERIQEEACAPEKSGKIVACKARGKEDRCHHDKRETAR